MAISLISPVAAYLIYGVFVVTVIVFTMAGRTETVMILPASADDRGRDLQSNA